MGANRHTSLVRAGFTLLELLTVMGIMLVIMGASFSLFHGFLRGAGLRSATLNVRSTLSLARQYAVTRRCKTQVLFWQDGTNSNYVMCMDAGQQVGADTRTLTMGNPQGGLLGGDFINLTTIKMGIVDSQTGTDSEYLSVTNPGGGYIQWSLGDRYGWPLRHQTHLPEGMVFTNGTGPGGAPRAVCFNPDGSTPMAGQTNYYVKITERGVVSPAVVTITVHGMTGQVTVQ